MTVQNTHDDIGSRVVVFGDEDGLPLACGALTPVLPAVVVVDPRRTTAVQWATTHLASVPVWRHPCCARRAQWLGRLAETRPALGLVVSYSRILWPELLDLFPQGVVNLHPGRLPGYRGANVLQWAILNGEAETAVTLHYVDKGVDTGPIIAEELVRIEKEDTAVTLRKKLREATAPILLYWLPRLLRGRVEAVHQDERRGRTWPRRRPEDGRIDWSWSNERISNLTRALVPPWPCAFYFDREGRRIVVKRALSPREVSELRQEVSG